MRRWIGLGLAGSWACGGVDLADGGGRDPTWHRDVRPIVERSCVRCHHGDGIGPFPLEDYGDVASRAEQVADAVADRRMPPWLASGDCHTYLHDTSLTQAEIDAVVRWAAAGAPEGDPADAPEPAEVTDFGLPRVDHVLEMPEAYVPEAVDDDYRCFVLPWPGSEPASTVTGYVVRPGESRIVHHVIGYVIPPESAADYDALDGADGRPGYTCFGGPGGPLDMYSAFNPGGYRWLGGWAPGGLGGAFPEGTGIPVEGGSRIVVQVHYHPLATEPDLADRSAIEVMVDPSGAASKSALIQPFTDAAWVLGQGMEIPAGAQGVEHAWSMPMPAPFVAYTANLHMHTLGRSARLSLRRADGSTTCLLDIPRWDFDWQLSYAFTEPVTVEAGDAIELSCTWDNPTDRDVAWGDGTGDEMCLATMYITEP